MEQHLGLRNQMLNDIEFVEVTENVFDEHIESFPKMSTYSLTDCLHITYYCDQYGKVYASTHADGKFFIRKEMLEGDNVSSKI